MPYSRKQAFAIVEGRLGFSLQHVNDRWLVRYPGTRGTRVYAGQSIDDAVQTALDIHAEVKGR